MSVKNHTTCTRTLPRFSKHLHPTRPKIPYKNNRELSANIREQQHSLYTEYFYFSTQDKSVFIIDELLEKKGRPNSDSTCSIKCAVAKLVQHTQIASVVLEIS